MKTTLSILASLVAVLTVTTAEARGPKLAVCSMAPAAPITYDGTNYPSRSTMSWDLDVNGGMDLTNRVLTRSICPKIDKMFPIEGELTDSHNLTRLQVEEAASEHTKRTMLATGFGQRVNDAGGGWSWARTGVGTLPEAPTRSVATFTSSSSSSSSSNSSSSSSGCRRQRLCNAIDRIQDRLAD